MITLDQFNTELRNITKTMLEALNDFEGKFNKDCFKIICVEGSVMFVDNNMITLEGVTLVPSKWGGFKYFTFDTLPGGEKSMLIFEAYILTLLELINGFIDKEGNKKYLFILNGEIGYNTTKSKNKGFYLTAKDLQGFNGYLSKAGEDFKKIEKYRKLAEKSKISTNYIQKCKDLPKTFEEWDKEGRYTLSQYGITIGTKFDGQTITLKKLEGLNIERVAEFKEYLNKGTKGVYFDVKVNDLFYSFSTGTETFSPMLAICNPFGKDMVYQMINDNTFIFVRYGI